MKTLVLVEHDNAEVAAATLSTVKAASSLGQDIDLLVATNSQDVVQKASKIEGVSKVLSFVDERFGNEIAEDVAECVVQLLTTITSF